MKRRLTRILIALPIIYAVLLGAQAGLTAMHAKSYFSSLSGEYDRATLDNQSNQVASDVNRLFALQPLDPEVLRHPHARPRLVRRPSHRR